ncbi:MAG: lipid A biosynthesis acyltransferase [Ectothiorhodospiraceae bacterium]|jgi:predicted LPLAT superfamily acyltransferase
MSAPWTANRGRGSEAAIRLMIWIALRLGRKPAYVVLHGITVYFVLLAPRARRASRDYLRRVLGRRPRLPDLYRHIWTFSCTLLDRVYILAGRDDVLNVDVAGGDAALSCFRGDRGCLVLGAHLGSFDVLRALARRDGRIQVRPMMYRDAPQTLDRVFESLNPEFWASVIPVGSTDSLLRAKDAVDGGQSVALLGDRATPGDRAVACRLFGETVWLPAGPLLVARALRIPVVLCFGIRTGWGRYRAHFETFATAADLAPEGGRPDLEKWLQQYADRLETHCRMAPYNWFNFYDYFDQPDPADARAVPRRPVGAGGR